MTKKHKQIKRTKQTKQTRFQLLLDGKLDTKIPKKDTGMCYQCGVFHGLFKFKLREKDVYHSVYTCTKHETKLKSAINIWSYSQKDITFLNKLLKKEVFKT